MEYLSIRDILKWFTFLSASMQIGVALTESSFKALVEMLSAFYLSMKGIFSLLRMKMRNESRGNDWKIFLFSWQIILNISWLPC